MAEFVPYLVMAALVGVGLIGGLLFVFSNFAMRAFAKLPEGEGMRAMQEINRTILNPLFLVIFMGTTAVAATSVVVGVMHTAAVWSTGLIAGGLLFGLGVFVVTAAGNVPLNNRLDRAEADSEEGRALWATYLRVWTKYNHVRVVSSVLAILAYGQALWSC
ncbi:MAG: anthrone oxygenase family protein [Planctomycetota bacterium]